MQLVSINEAVWRHFVQINNLKSFKFGWQVAVGTPKLAYHCMCKLKTLRMYGRLKTANNKHKIKKLRMAE